MSSQKPARGRPRAFDADAAIEAAMLTFWRQGYAGTSLDDLVVATGASRASLYALYGDKRRLFERSLGLYAARFAERIDAALAEPVDGRERIAMVLNASADRLVSPEAPPGCLRCNSTLELMGTDAGFDALLGAANDGFLATLSRLTDRAAADGEITAEAAPGLALFFTAIVDGLVTLARGGAGREALAVVIESAMRAWPVRS